jgi:hypothetical protein
MTRKLDANSYLFFSQIFDVDGVEFWDLVDFPEVFPQDDDIEIVIGKGEVGSIISDDESIRPDLISYRIYGTPNLWWIIALRNGFEIIPSELKSGETILVPSPRYVFQEYLPQSGRQ